jgi:hypothetical protein
MIVGVLEFEVVIRQSQSLKDKRRAVKSLKDRLLHRFPISIAEVDFLDHWQRSGLGAAIVSNDAQHATEVLSKVVDFVRNSLVVELVDYSIETF